jgi:DNA-binding transcriptional LysR family regulator
MWSGLTPTLSEQLVNRELDLAVCTEATLDSKRVELRPLFSECLIAVCPKTRANQGTPLKFQELLRDLPLLRYTARSVIGQQVERFVTHMNFYAPKRYEFDDTDPILGLVATGFGCAITTPLCLWQSRVHLNDVCVVPLPQARLGHRHFFLLTRRSEWSDVAEAVAQESIAIVRDFIEPSLRALLPGLPPKIVDSYAATLEDANELA